MNQEVTDNTSAVSHPHADWSRFNTKDPGQLRQAVMEYQEELLANPGMPPITEEQLAALLQRFPFLQLFHDQGDFEQEYETSLVEVSTGWVICDYFYALSSSPGQRCYVAELAKITEGSSSTDDDADDASGGGVGTIVRQAYETARLMVAMARDRGWQSVRAVDGCALMKWAAWVAAQEFGLPFVGYEPDEQARAKRERLRRDSQDLDIICRKLQKAGSMR